MAKGTVKWYSDTKKFGFIAPDDGSRDLFFTLSNINGIKPKTIIKGQIVDYKPPKKDKGRHALNVSLLLT